MSNQANLYGFLNFRDTTAGKAWTGKLAIDGKQYQATMETGDIARLHLNSIRKDGKLGAEKGQLRIARVNNGPQDMAGKVAGRIGSLPFHATLWINRDEDGTAYSYTVKEDIKPNPVPSETDLL